MKNLIKSRQNRGITLVALVITIILLLILASVTINLTIGNNGLFTTAKQAKEECLNAQTAEEDGINDLYSEMLVATGDDSKITISVEELNELIDKRIADANQVEDLSDNVTFNTDYIDSTNSGTNISVLKYGNLVQVTFLLYLKASIPNGSPLLVSGLPKVANDEVFYFVGNDFNSNKANFKLYDGSMILWFCDLNVNTVLYRFCIIYNRRLNPNKKSGLATFFIL